MLSHRHPGAAASSRFLTVGAVAAVGYLAWFGWLMENATYDVWGAAFIGPLLLLATMPLAAAIARADGDRRMIGFVFGAVVLKLAAAVVMHVVTDQVYEGVADANLYMELGEPLADTLRSGDLRFDPGGKFGVVGTGFMIILSGIAQAIVGPTQIGIGLIFSWLGFCGLLLFYRAFNVALPAGDSRHYGALVLFLPSLLFWSSTLGKEAWMTLSLGVSAYGVARMVTSQRWGFSMLGVGIVASLMVRPHVALFVCVGGAVAYALRRSHRGVRAHPLKLVGLAAMLGLGLFVVSQAEGVLGVEKLDLGSVKDVLADTQARTRSYAGGSSFDLGLPFPLSIPGNVVTVLYRPFPFETHNLQSLVASAEGMFLLWLSWRRRAVLVRVLRHALDRAYVAYAASFSAIFVLAFASLSNFGLLVRQRTQVLPLVLVLLCLSRQLFGAGRAEPLSRSRGGLEEHPVEARARGARDTPIAT